MGPCSRTTVPGSVPLRGRELIHDGRSYVALECPLGIFAGPILIARDWFHQVVRHFDGTNTLGSIQDRLLRETSQQVPIEQLRSLAADLDRALALDSPALARFLDDYRAQRVRPAAHAGASYPAEERGLRAQLARYFADPEGSGPPSEAARNGHPRVRGILSPHIDFARGGPTYTHAYKELVERSDADVFVIFGVAHSPCRQRFALTRKDFQTPLGIAPDRPGVRRRPGRLGRPLAVR